MRKVFLFMMVTLDGFFEGPGHEIDWHNVDEEFNEFAIDQQFMGHSSFRCLIPTSIPHQRSPCQVLF